MQDCGAGALKHSAMQPAWYLGLSGWIGVLPPPGLGELLPSFQYCTGLMPSSALLPLSAHARTEIYAGVAEKHMLWVSKLHASSVLSAAEQWLRSAATPISARPDGTVYAEQEVANLSDPCPVHGDSLGFHDPHIWETTVKLALADTPSFTTYKEDNSEMSAPGFGVAGPRMPSAHLVPVNVLDEQTWNGVILSGKHIWSPCSSFCPLLQPSTLVARLLSAVLLPS
ncbi:cadherin-4-like protein [Lates japonicus]|uniref:Cadherin-4-like protein n=1 Tax=Lates japonicus TaxID=270547 RepID=A0AAD3MVA2_LATJO|nr:cadherin-4-like protein [Lates japonicus]